MRFSWQFPWLRREPSEVETSDFGRRYGWLAEKDVEVVAKLDYICWNEYMQFWHEYKLTILRPDMNCLDVDSNAWLTHGITLRNVRFTDVVISEFIVSAKGNGNVSVRFAYVPEERFKKQQNGV